MLKNFKRVFSFFLSFMLLLQFSFINTFAETGLNEANNDSTSSNQTVSSSVYSDVYSSVYGQAVELQMYNSNTADETNTISPRIKIENKGTKAISLKDLKIRYYYFYDDEKLQNFYCDYSNVGNQNITGTFVKMQNPQINADNYCEIGFKDAAGILEPGKYVEIHTRIAKSDWSNYNQTDDYSFDKSDISYVNNETVTVNIGGSLIWGIVPIGKPYKKQLIQLVKLQMYNGSTETQTNTLFPRFKLINTGNLPINLENVRIRYYYTIDGDKDQKYWCDYSNIGQEKITGKFVKSEDGIRENTNCYFEMGFDKNSGILEPGKFVEAHIRIAKTDWSNYTQSNDYSFDNIQNDYVDWDKADVYIGDNLVWGKVLINEFTDSDNDGITDMIEKEIGSDPKNSDTDGDGLPDGYEYYTLNTNPCSIDSNNNGIKDGDEDFDNDKLTNIEEYKLGTNPYNIDTDGDGLNDYEEVKIYNTDPLKVDSDSDGLNDYDEIKLGYNPNKADSNDNGIIDSKEKTEQVIDLGKDFSSDYNGNLITPSIKVFGAGNLNSTTTVNDVYYYANFKDVRAIVGDPIQVDSYSKFDWMDIGFKIQLNNTRTVRSSHLAKNAQQGNVVKGQEVRNNRYVRALNVSSSKSISLDNLILAEYKKETNQIIPLSSTIDVDTNTIKARVDHDGIFLLLDKNILQYDWDVANTSSTIEKGKADITFVLDSTGSMSSSINNVKNNIVDFVNSLSENKVDANLGLVEFKDIDEDGVNSTKNYGWFNNPEDFKNIVSGIYAGGGGDYPESDVDALEEARKMGFTAGSQKFIILITDAPYKEDTRFSDLNSMQEEISRLKNDGIIVSVISSDSSWYGDLYNQTNGIFSDINSSFSDNLKALIDNIKNNVTDGTWVRLTNGSIVKLNKEPDKNDMITDTDGDGIPDSQELGEKVKIEYPVGSGKFIEAWTFTSNPVKKDTDGDGFDDKAEVIAGTDPNDPDDYEPTEDDDPGYYGQCCWDSSEFWDIPGQPIPDIDTDDTIITDDDIEGNTFIRTVKYNLFTAQSKEYTYTHSAPMYEASYKTLKNYLDNDKSTKDKLKAKYSIELNTDAVAKALLIAGAYEDGQSKPNWGSIVGNNDNCGLSAGYLHFNFYTETLQPIFLNILKNKKGNQEAKDILGKDYKTFVKILSSSKKEQLEWAKSISTGEGLYGEGVQDNWRDELSKLLSTSYGKKCQLKQTYKYIDEATNICSEKGYNLKSEVAYTVAMNIAVQCGSTPYDKIHSYISAKKTEKNKLKFIVDTTAHNVLYTQNVIDRDMGIINLKYHYASKCKISYKNSWKIKK